MNFGLSVLFALGIAGIYVYFVETTTLHGIYASVIDQPAFHDLCTKLATSAAVAKAIHDFVLATVRNAVNGTKTAHTILSRSPTGEYGSFMIILLTWIIYLTQIMNLLRSAMLLAVMPFKMLVLLYAALKLVIGFAVGVPASVIEILSRPLRRFL